MHIPLYSIVQAVKIVVKIKLILGGVQTQIRVYYHH